MLPTLEQRMDDVRAVMDAVASERAAIFGASEGGQMSMLFAATYPERTVALSIFGSTAKRLWSADYPWAPTPESRKASSESIEQHWTTGLAAHTGARIVAMAAPGEVLASSTVKDLVAGSGIECDDRGDHELKGVPGEWRLYGVRP
jgi:pimeloyl-ACP methyl ester carboxylesterase